MELPLYFNYSVNNIKKIEKEIINTNKEWLKNIKLIKNIDPYDFLESYVYKESKFDYIYYPIIFLKYVSTNKDIRIASNNFELHLKNYYINFYNSDENYNLFSILKKIKTNDNNNIQKVIKRILKDKIVISKISNNRII